MVNAEVMDIFGVLVFTVLLVIGISLLKTTKKRAILIIIIAVLGLIVDTAIVTMRFMN